MGKRLKLRLCRIFQSSFFSCRSNKNSDIIITNKPKPKPTNFISSKPPQLPLISPKPPQFPLISPKPPPPPISNLKHCLSRRKTTKSTKPRSKKHSTRPSPAAAAATEDVGGVWWYGGGDDGETEDETETLFSSRSMTSDSSASRRRRRRKHGGRRSERDGKDGFFAVVKRTLDPYKDFKASMAEMVVEKKIFGGNELEELLQCFISLNSRHYHSLIFQVHSEIKQALFLL